MIPSNEYKDTLDLLRSYKYLGEVLGNNKIDLTANERFELRISWKYLRQILLRKGGDSMRINLEKGNIDFLINLYTLGDKARLTIE